MLRMCLSLEKNFDIDLYSKEIQLHLCKSIKKVRYEKGLTILELSSICDVSPGYLSDVENGKHMNVSMRFLIKICFSLNINLPQLLEESLREKGQ